MTLLSHIEELKTKLAEKDAEINEWKRVASEQAKMHDESASKLSEKEKEVQNLINIIAERNAEIAELEANKNQELFNLIVDAVCEGARLQKIQQEGLILKQAFRYAKSTIKQLTK